MEVEVQEVRNRRELDEFLRFPAVIYRGDGLYVPPHEASLRGLLTPGTSPFLPDRDCHLFLARRSGEVVGRIGAFRERRPQGQASWDGEFGFFECREDSPVAGALLDAAASALGSLGARSMVGPVNLSINLECGLLVEGDGGPPALMTTHNPPWYSTLLEGWGLERRTDLLTYTLPLPAPGGRLHRIADRWRRRTALTVRPLDRRRYVREMTAIGEVFNRAWEENPGASELSEAGIQYLVREFRPILDPSLVFLARWGEEVVGFALALPDVNPLLQFISRFPNLLQLPAALGHRLFRRPRRARLLALGVLPEHRGNGLTAALVTAVSRGAAASGYHRLELSWILAENRDARRYAEALGATVTRRHRLYSIDLARKLEEQDGIGVSEELRRGFGE